MDDRDNLYFFRHKQRRDVLGQINVDFIFSKIARQCPKVPAEFVGGCERNYFKVFSVSYFEIYCCIF